MRVTGSIRLVAALLMAPRLLEAQERGAAALGEEVRGLDVTTRVLMIGAHPDDEDTQLLTWLARGRRVETAYLSLTRGDGGQNLIGNELGPALGVLRTQELLAARRVDGARQYFTRAYDFGFSKNAEETYRFWPRELLLQDVVTVVRAFRPHVIVAVFSGTPRDGHGHHQVSGQLAREAFDVAGDTLRIPRRLTGDLGGWTPAKFYRAARFDPANATLRMNVGEFNPVLGRSYAEIAGESRSQHRSQAFGTLQPKGVRWDYVRLEASRVTSGDAATAEPSLFAGIDTTWHRFEGLDLPPAVRAALSALPASTARIGAALDLREPARAVAPLAGHVRLLRSAHDSLVSRRGTWWRRDTTARCPGVYVPTCGERLGDLAASLTVALERAERALVLAAGVAVEAVAPRGLVAAGDTLPVVIEVYNRGTVPIELHEAAVMSRSNNRAARQALGRTLLPDSASRDTLPLVALEAVESWWLPYGLVGGGGIFNLGDNLNDTLRLTSGWPGVEQLVVGEDRARTHWATVDLVIAGAPVRVEVPKIVHRYADPAQGEVRRPIASVPPVNILLPSAIEYAPAGRPIEREVRVALQSSTTRPRSLTVELRLPEGLRADSATRTVTLQPFQQASVAFKLRGTLAQGWTQIEAVASSDGQRFTRGFVPIEYAHIDPQQFYRPARTYLSVVDAALPRGVAVGYVPGVGDNVAPMLTQLGIPVTILDTASLATADLSRFTTIVVGPRAYEASDALVAANARIIEFARRGGTVVVQYGQYEMQRPGIMPHPISIARPHDRVTDERAPVRFLDPRHPLLRVPNAIDSADFAGWVQERALYMPRTFDPAYTPVLEMNDPDEPPNRGAILVAPVGRGTYVYTTLSFFRQLPVGVQGPARLFVNLLGGGRPTVSPAVPRSTRPTSRAPADARPAGR